MQHRLLSLAGGFSDWKSGGCCCNHVQGPWGWVLLVSGCTVIRVSVVWWISIRVVLGVPSVRVGIDGVRIVILVSVGSIAVVRIAVRVTVSCAVGVAVRVVLAVGVISGVGGVSVVLAVGVVSVVGVVLAVGVVLRISVVFRVGVVWVVGLRLSSVRVVVVTVRVGVGGWCRVVLAVVGVGVRVGVVGRWLGDCDRGEEWCHKEFHYY